MGALAEGWRRFRSLLRRQELQDGLDEEIRFHIESQAARYRRAGMPPAEAHRQAILRFGGINQAREDARDEFRASGLEDLARDLRVGWRALRRAPTFLAVSVLTLALGIGGTTAMFSVVYGVILRPLPYPDQDRLVEIIHRGASGGQLLASPAVYFGYRDYNRTFEAIGHWDWDSSPVTVTGGGEPASVSSLEMTHEVLPILGAAPVAGRTFTAADDRPGAAPTVIISHRYWQRRYGGAPAVGRTLMVDGIAREVIGVLPESFRFFEYDADLFYPLQHVRAEARHPSGDGRALARLKPGVTLEAANADVARMLPLLTREFNPGFQGPLPPITPALRPLKDAVVGDLGQTLWILMGTMALLLVIACANVANLMLVRTQSRRADLVVRSALGAGPIAVARVVLAEAGVVGLIGGLGGVVLAYLALPFLLALGVDDLPQIMTVRVDPTVLIVSALTALGVTVVTAAIPLAHLAIARSTHAEALRASRSTSDGPGGLRTRQLLVMAQVATALVLLIGSGLMIRTFLELRRVEPGFRDADAVQTFLLTIPGTGPLGGEANVANRDRLLATQRALVERLAAVGGVDAVGMASGNDGLPLDGDGRQMSLVPYVDGVQVQDGLARMWEVQHVSPGFFEAQQTRIVAGRGLSWDDVDTARPVMLVSETLARKEWGSAGAALGRRISAFPATPGAEIIGVVEDVHHDGVAQPAPALVAYGPRAVPTSAFVIRTARAGQADLLVDLGRAVNAVHGGLSIAQPRTLGAMYRQSLGRARMTLLLLGVTGAVALVLGLVGVYGMVSYTVSRRRREIGIRLALGARRADVSAMFLRHAVTLVAAGVVIGLAASASLTRVIASQLFGVTALDVATHLAVAAGLIATASVASYISAQRGSAVDPIEVLKAD